MATSQGSDAGGAGGVTDLAFTELRPAMFALAYRITGSRADAEDIVQDAFLRFHRAAPEEAVQSLKAYLTTITARLSFNRLRDLRARRETYVGEWLPEPVSTKEEPAVRAEDVSFALMVVLERLSPLERVVLVLRNAFDLSFEEIAPVVRRDTVTCRKIFSRARARVAQERPRFTVDRERHRALMLGFLQAARGQDMDALVSLLDDNVVLHGDGGGKALALKQAVVGNIAAQRRPRPGGKGRRPHRGRDHDRHRRRAHPFGLRGCKPGQARGDLAGCRWRGERGSVKSGRTQAIS
jgi:RNA polymerase sigma-70 factor (ECF subfamily)